MAFTDAAGNFLVQPSTLTGCGYQLGNGKCYATGAVTANSKRDLRTESRFYDGATVLPSAERYNTFAFMNYDISDDVAFFGELGLYNAETEALGSAPSSLASTPILPIDKVVTSFYLRLQVADQAGVLARITGILAEHNISIDALLQRESAQGETHTDVIILTHNTVEGEMSKAVAQMQALPTVLAPIVKIRKEDLT